MLIRQLNNTGDTIVEVLISIAVVSSVLGAGYVGANHSSTTIQEAQEHQIATSIAQTQLELLNSQTGLARLNTPTPTFPSSALPSCYAQVSGTYLLNTPNTGKQSRCSPYDSSVYPENFNVNITDVTDPSQSPPPTLDTYQVEVSWQHLGGAQKNDIKMFFQTAGQ